MSVLGLKGQMDAVESLLRVNKDSCTLNQRLIGYFLQRVKLEDKREELENASRRNNIRIYSVPKDSEIGDTVKWVENFIKELLQLPSK